MANYSKTWVYKNGNKVMVGEGGDHTQVREILRNGAVNRVANFGPLLSDKDVPVNDGSKLTVGDFELLVIPQKESHEFSLGGGFTTVKDVNLVYYQRIGE